MYNIPVLIPAPCWQPLSYLSPEPVKFGSRVIVPLGKANRHVTGVAWNEFDFFPKISPAAPVSLKPIIKVIDKEPVIPRDLLQLVSWVAQWFVVQPGNALEMLLPRWILKGARISFFAEIHSQNYEKNLDKSEINFYYEPEDELRLARLARIAEESEGQLIAAFPDRMTAVKFYEQIKGKRSAGLYPTSVAAQKNFWIDAAQNKYDALIGCQNVLTAPLSGLKTIILDQEESDAWRALQHPFIHWRSIAARRARYRGAALHMCGRLPSGGAYMRIPPDEEFKNAGLKNPAARLIFVDMKLVKDKNINNKESIISKPLIRETFYALEQGQNILWMLDRKGFAGTLLCSDCGYTFSCCGAKLVWHKKEDRLKCPVCKKISPAPEYCPKCKGSFIETARPGLEALYQEATGIFGFNKHVKKIILKDAGVASQKEAKSWEGLLGDGGNIILGTRGALELCNLGKISLVCWVQADGEAAGRDHDAACAAFRLLWDSCWRGEGAGERKIVVQSYAPTKGWRGCLTRGFSAFWSEELKERFELGLPPYSVMAQVTADEARLDNYAANFDKIGMSYVKEEKNILVRAKSHTELKNGLVGAILTGEAISRYPRVKIWKE